MLKFNLYIQCVCAHAVCVCMRACAYACVRLHMQMRVCYVVSAIMLCFLTLNMMPKLIAFMSGNVKLLCQKHVLFTFT